MEVRPAENSVASVYSYTVGVSLSGLPSPLPLRSPSVQPTLDQRFVDFPVSLLDLPLSYSHPRPSGSLPVPGHTLHGTSSLGPPYRLTLLTSRGGLSPLLTPLDLGVQPIHVDSGT